MAVSLVLIVTSLCIVIVLNGITPWLRRAWILRKLPRGSKNILFGGLVTMLSPNRLRALEKLNEDTVNGSGVFYFNILWRQVYSLSAISNNCGHEQGGIF